MHAHRAAALVPAGARLAHTPLPCLSIHFSFAWGLPLTEQAGAHVQGLCRISQSRRPTPPFPRSVALPRIAHPRRAGGPALAHRQHVGLSDMHTSVGSSARQQHQTHAETQQQVVSMSTAPRRK